MLLNILLNSLFYYLIFNLTYYITGLFLFLIDHLKMFYKYKIQEEKNKIIIDTYGKIISTIIPNTFVYIIPALLLIGYYDSLYEEEFYPRELLYILPAGFVLTDFFFYICHKILHIPILYRWFHKKHHEITAPIGLSAVYTTVGDLYFGNILPIYLPMYIFRAHPITFKIWMFVSTLNTVIFAHSGFKWFADFHDFHHSNFSKNFGINLYMDRILRTSY